MLAIILLLASIKVGADLPVIANRLFHFYEKSPGSGLPINNLGPLCDAVEEGDLSQLTCDQMYILGLYTNQDEESRERLYPECASRCSPEDCFF